MRARLLPLLLPLLLLAPAAHGKLRVVGTLPDFAALARAIGGDRVEAMALIKGTQDPHYVDAKPSMIVKVNRADLLISIGLGLEVGWLPVLLTQGRNGKVQVGAPGHLDASSVIRPLEVPVKADRAMGDVHGGGNPHYYTSPVEMFTVARAIRDKLKALDPEGAAHYDARWSEFETQYSSKLAGWRSRLASVKGTQVVVYHQSWVYLLEWAGLKRAGVLEPKPGIPPSPAHVSRVLSTTRDQGVKFVIQEVYHPRRLSSVFAKKARARLLVLPSMVGAAEGIETIWDKFDRIVEELTDGE